MRIQPTNNKFALGFKQTSQLLLLLATVLGTITFSRAQNLPLAPQLIDYASEDGVSLLQDSQSLQDYLPLSAQFETQENLAYCGVASIVMVLNALKIEAPEAPEYWQYHRFTQKNLWSNPQAEAVITAEKVSRGGMTLAQLGGLLSSYPVEVAVVHAENTTLNRFRQQVVQNLQESNNYVLVNYLRKNIGQETGGHISPIAAYHAPTDRFLILDVARYKYPPVWVEATALWTAINTQDRTSGKSRGYVMVGLSSP